MSHFTELKTNLGDLTRIAAAARRLKLDVNVAEGTPLYARGFMDNRFEAAAVIQTGSRYDIGVVQQADGSFDLVADWELLEKCSNVRREELLGKLKQQYALISIEDMAKAKGLSISTPTIAEDGSIEVTVASW